ncbi:EAL domain-containing response regulator [Comamonas thiooxydans]|jgi:EAL domain-containing protein (putative c-di-GMP-specific phosphodiesterase class I)/CheY-like chemotaxis protein|uniref:EAL domain-containing response regulator n=1 Tax=Comamonas TaxID=283 RepID=UPI0015C9B0B0|nr:EAL domain-containing response regulator [Comamonas thiooxydans]MDH1476998.1 EAL domain-containing response regulator [Comamonas thiooxydans]
MLSKYKVLVLDDHAFQCIRLKDMLEEAGFAHVDAEQSASVALTRIKEQGYNVVVMDVNMPLMDGAQFIDQLARQDLNPVLAIVTACSRRMANSISLMAKERGFAVIGSFVKPIVREQIDEMVRNLLRRPAAERSSAAACDDRVLDKESMEIALRDGSIRAWFQPKKSLLSGSIVGAEALVRWQHRDFGLMMPASFLKSLHDYGLDHALLMRMVEDGVDAYRTWRRQGYRVPISINLPTSLLDQQQLPDELHAIVTNCGVPTEDVTFELLEDDMSMDAGQFYMGASRLRLRGFGLSQDDFGKGYSSMYNLISIPFTELKIDRAFVYGAASDEVLAAALASSVQLGKQLGLLVTAEGVETMEDLQFVRQLGCDCAQGYLISAAIDAPAFGELLIDEPKLHFPDSAPH